MSKAASAALLLPIALAVAADRPLPKLESAAALDHFFFPADEEAIFDSMQTVFQLDNPRLLVTVSAAAGPAYASKVASTIPDPEFRSQYAQLAKYLDQFGPCQKKQKPDAEGWWSGYTTYPGDPYCREAAKLIFANTLWSQAHYCRQLATGEAKPKSGPPPAHDPPFRLDEPPVKTQWLNAEAIYALVDAAVAAPLFGEPLRARISDSARDPAERAAIADAARELERKPLNRELAGLALVKMMVRSYESLHLRHLRQLPAEAPAPPR